MRRDLLLVIVISSAVVSVLFLHQNKGAQKSLYGEPEILGIRLNDQFKPSNEYKEIKNFNDSTIHRAWVDERRHLFVECIEREVIRLIGPELRCGDYQFSQPFERDDLIRALHPTWIKEWGRGSTEDEFAANLKVGKKTNTLRAALYSGESNPLGKRDSPMVLYQLIGERNTTLKLTIGPFTRPATPMHFAIAVE